MFKSDLYTGNLNYVRAVYNLQKVNNSATVFDYDLADKWLKKDEVFTDVIRVELDNGFHERSRYFDYWLLLRDTTNWKTCKRTGLANTYLKNVYEGNIPIELELLGKTKKGKNYENPKHWVVVWVKNDFKTLVVDVFKDFYPRDKERINAILNEHKF